MEHCVRLYPLGHPVELVSNSKAAVDAAEESWGDWPQLFDQAPLRFRVDVGPGPEAVTAPEYRPAGGGFYFKCDPANGAAFHAQSACGQIHAAQGTVEQRAWFRYHLLEAAVLTALDTVFFTPVHAACVARRGRGLLLCGDSGAGKTTLAYACARAGWTLISDEAVHLAPESRDLLVGASRVFRLREPARDLFPELQGLTAAATMNGKSAIQINAKEYGMRVDWSAIASGTVFLARRSGAAALDPFSTDAAVAYVLKYLDYLPQSQRDSARRRIRDFLACGCQRLEYEKVSDAVALLETLV
jgi:hypothetical protein